MTYILERKAKATAIKFLFSALGHTLIFGFFISLTIATNTDITWIIVLFLVTLGGFVLAPNIKGAFRYMFSTGSWKIEINKNKFIFTAPQEDPNGSLECAICDIAYIDTEKRNTSKQPVYSYSLHLKKGKQFNLPSDSGIAFQDGVNRMKELGVGEVLTHLSKRGKLIDRSENL